MDDASRAELAELRRRAYGPAPDLAGDEHAAERLRELEAAFHHEHPELIGDPWVTDPQDDGADAATAVSEDAAVRADRAGPEIRPPGPTGGEAGAPAYRTAPPRRRLPIALLGTGALIALGMTIGITIAGTPGEPPAEPAATTAAASAPPPASSASILITIPLEAHLAPGTPLPEGTPQMPSRKPVQWAASLGDFYGWALWVAGSPGGLIAEHCLLIERGPVARGQCHQVYPPEDGVLTVSLGYNDIAEADRPSGMTRGELIVFSWQDDRAVLARLTSSLEQ